MTLSPFAPSATKAIQDREDANRLELVNRMIGDFIKTWGPKGDDYALAQFSAELVTLVHRLYLLASESQAKVLAEILPALKPMKFGFLPRGPDTRS